MAEIYDMQDDVIEVEQQSLLRRQTSNQKCVLCYQRWLTMAFTACGDQSDLLPHHIFQSLCSWYQLVSGDNGKWNAAGHAL